MASRLAACLLDGPGLAAQVAPSLALASLLGVVAMVYLRARQALPAAINPKGRFELTATRVHREFAASARSLLGGWFREHPRRPVTLNADIGLVTVLPPHMADEIRNDKRLSFAESMAKVCRRLFSVSPTAHVMSRLCPPPFSFSLWAETRSRPTTSPSPASTACASAWRRETPSSRLSSRTSPSISVGIYGAPHRRPPPPSTTDETARVRCSSADAPTFEPGKATQPLAEETSAALRDLLTDDTGK